MKEASMKKLYAVWLQLYNILKKTIESRDQSLPGAHWEILYLPMYKTHLNLGPEIWKKKCIT